jgi:L-rhamnose mutarotase
MITKEGAMTITRFAIQRELKSERVDDYIKYHQNVPEGLMDIYREAGILDISCFVCDTHLIVYFEVDQEVYEKSQAALSQNLVDSKWQALMRTLNDPDAPILTYKEVFRM